ncbi:hypothetical protein [Demequina sp. NBRC 110056]|uniref:hypothetical protein n=1 Tax=Demequina sp. NBRC 110056 TaxID=1570345 RepID=UPI000A01C651|nr:hypothetical protein [Demequina sp. NBRC 110056]
MVPAGLLAIIALGLVIAYVLPQRVRERGEYALVRVDDRYSSDMRVVKSSAERVERKVARPSADSGELPLLRTGGTRASARVEHMSRPATPLDRAAVHAQREQHAMRRDRARIGAARAAQAKRRGYVALAATLAATLAWSLVIFAGASAVLGAIATSVLVGVVTSSSRAASAQRRADADLLAVSREVEAAATATQALRIVSRERAAGHEAEPSDVATQAIRIVTAEDLAPLAAPAVVPSPELPVEEAETGTPWVPQDMPAPAYTLKPTVRQREARPISDDDYDVAKARAARWGDLRADDAPERSTAAYEVDEAAPTTAALDAILARRRRASA